MLIIPAIDLVLNKVVKANAGKRTQYKNLKIGQTDYSSPKKFIKLLLTNFKFKTIYIADLDSISKPGRTNWPFLKRIIYNFPDIFFWIDSGLENLTQIRLFNEFINKSQEKKKRFKIVVGTESFKVKEDIKKLPENCIVSLDFNGTEKGWFKYLDYNKELILMFIKNVGGHGIDWKKLKHLEKFFSTKKCFIAGGVKDLDDIRDISNKDYKGVIVSTYIHNKIN
tara:strand:- start:50 stop:721 length:672 start_codon:yes stop_codon:yes gene_type:complete